MGGRPLANKPEEARASFVAGSSEASRHTTGDAARHEAAQPPLGGGGRGGDSSPPRSRSAPGTRWPATRREDRACVVLSPGAVSRGRLQSVPAADSRRQQRRPVRRTVGDAPGQSVGRGGAPGAPTSRSPRHFRGGRNPPFGRLALHFLFLLKTRWGKGGGRRFPHAACGLPGTP